jgi:hypothetical protein
MTFFGRGKNKIKQPYTLPDMYKAYVEEYPEGNIYYISYKDFIAINEEFYKRIMEEVMYRNATFKLPFRMGYLKIIKRKINFKNKLAIDWKTTNDIGRKVYHMNDHSGGYKYIFKWIKTNIIAQNKYLYRLVITRKYKRELAKLIKQGGIDYFEE